MASLTQLSCCAFLLQRKPSDKEGINSEDRHGGEGEGKAGALPPAVSPPQTASAISPEKGAAGQQHLTPAAEHFTPAKAKAGQGEGAADCPGEREAPRAGFPQKKERN